MDYGTIIGQQRRGCKMRRFSGAKLKQKREWASKSRRHLADLMNCLDPGAKTSHTHIRKWEDEGAIPSANYLLLMCEALCVVVEDLFDLVSFEELVIQDPARFTAAYLSKQFLAKKHHQRSLSGKGMCPVTNRHHQESQP